MRYVEMEGIGPASLASGVCTLKGEGPWKGINEDSYEAYRELGQIFGLKPDRIVRPKQEHTDKVLLVDESMGGMGSVAEGPLPAADGLITDIPGMVLCVITADCVPVAMLDPVHRAIGIVHSGWKGTAARISVRALSMMREAYGTDPADLRVYIGPHICGDCYEVGEELIPRFEEGFRPEDISSFFAAKGMNSQGELKYLLNMGQAISCSLIQEGVTAEHIRASSRCTFKDQDLNSYRRDRQTGQPFTGRNLSAIALK